jgi:hypothetical protein
MIPTCRRPACLVAAVLVLLAHAAPPAEAAQPTELKAFFRDGQTFLTWTECGADRYHVYRSDERIADVGKATRVAAVARGSSTYPLEVKRKVLAKISGTPGYGARYVIHDNPDADPAKMLPADTGLFVHTAHEDGTFFYAVTAVRGGKEDTTLGDANRLAEGIAEKVEPPGAVLVYKAPVKDRKTGKLVGDRRVYCHWMDHTNWNPKPYGGYAVNFGVGATRGKPRGMCMFLHGYSGYYKTRGPVFGMVSLVPGDPHQTWFYGHKNAKGDVVFDYTERRMVLTVDTVVRLLQSEGIKIDTNKIYIHGGSMGGTGANFLGARHGDVFAAVLASKGAVDHNRNGNWTRSAERRLWGTREQNLPTNSGDRVWEHQNLIRWHAKHVEKETAFFLDAHASNDGSIPFGAIPDYYAALQKAKRPFAAVWAPWGHSGFEDPHWPNHAWWGVFTFNKDESVPAIANASSSDDPRKTRRGEINTHIEWSSREHDFDKNSQKDDLVDETDRWEICLRSCNYHRTQSRQRNVDQQTADITPRRCRKFKPKPGQTFRWENWSFADPAKPVKIAEGTVVADKHGLVTVTKFEIRKAGWGNRLVLRRAE